MSNLILLTNGFPYGNWEPYLETEIKYYDAFERVYMIALQIRKEHMEYRRTVGDNVVIIPVPYAPKWKYLIYAGRALLDVNLYKEFHRLMKHKRLSFTNLINLFVYFSRSHYEARKAAKGLHGLGSVDVVFYSYRFEYQPYVAYLLRKKLKMGGEIVARAHGYDLYEEVHPGDYIPMREELLEIVKEVYPCSANGRDYLCRKYPKLKNKIITKFLGTVDYGVSEYNWDDDTIRIVTCSAVVKVKRLNLLIEALSQMKDIPILWTHYGDGVLMEEIKKLANEKLAGNIRFDFKGNVTNQKLVKEYSEINYFVFVNISSSEGIPVSIMEAASFGIPCIATDAGGTKEIVENGKNGVLLPPDITAKQLAIAIKTFCNCDRETYFGLRREARKLWNRKYNSQKNYMKFVDELKGI